MDKQIYRKFDDIRKLTNYNQITFLTPYVLTKSILTYKSQLQLLFFKSNFKNYILLRFLSNFYYFLFKFISTNMLKPDSKYYISTSFLQLQDLPDEVLFNSQPFTLKFIHSFSEIPYVSEHIESFTKVNQDKFITQMESIAFNSHLKVIPICETRKSIEQGNSTSGNTEEISYKENQVTEKKVGCNCKKTGCLKMYCQCFSSGKICTKQCNCCNCSNHQKSLDRVQKAKILLNQKNSRSTFDALSCSTKKKCTCKKSQCQKKYCECFNAGQSCNESCKCEDCLNGTHTNEQVLRQKLEKKIIF